MSLRIKLIFTIVAAIILNVLLLWGYWCIYFSDSFNRDFRVLQEQLDNKTADIAGSVNQNSSFKEITDSYSDNGTLMFRLENLDGKVISESMTKQMDSLSINSVSPVSLYGNMYFLRITEPLPIKTILELPSIRKMLHMEFIFILVILVFSNIIIYVKIIRPIELLQRDILNYKSNHKAKYSNRHDEIGKLQNSFAKLTENLEEEKRKQNRIIASIAHDIKTPLTSVMGYAERLKKNKLSSERTDKYVDTIYSKSLVIKDLIEEFDDYLSYNIKNTLKKQEIKVSELMNNIVFDYEDELNHLGICLKIQNQCPNVTINVDILKLQRLFGNIISNSLKYLNKEEKWIEISCSETNKSVIFSIADNGMGVSEELLTQIFEPMYTSDASRSVAGLGLAICKEIVEIHSGEIWAKNNSFGGLTIICKLPVCQ